MAVIDEPDDYRFRAGEDLAGEVRRVARTRADHALAALRDDLAADPVEAVHTARKDLKKIRSLLRLLREALGDAVYGRENDALREAANGLGGIRDADVMLETLDALDTRFPGLTAATAPLRASIGSERPDDIAPRDEGAVTIIAEVAARIGDWRLDESESAINAGLARAYRRGRKRFADAREKPSAEAMHEWRKRGKDLWYHLRLLADAWPGILEPLAEEVHAMTDHLGAHHDLAVLADRAKDELPKGEPLAALIDAVERKQSEHETAALALGERVYAEKPKAFSKRMQRITAARDVASRQDQSALEGPYSY